MGFFFSGGAKIPPQTGQAGEFLQTDGSTVSWQSFGGAQGAMADSIGIVDPNTQVPADLSAAEWDGANPYCEVRVQPNVSSDGEIDWQWLNHDGAAVGSGRKQFKFVATGTTTRVTFQVRYPVGGSAQDFFVGVFDYGVTSEIDSTVVTTSSSVVTVTLDVTTVVDTVYTVLFVFNDVSTYGTTAQAQALIRALRVTPTAGASGVFAAPYIRIACDARTLWYNLYRDDTRVNATYRYASCLSSLLFRTSASSAAIEFVDTLDVTPAGIGVFANGQPLANLLPGGGLVPEIQTVSIPHTATALNSIDVMSGPQNRQVIGAEPAGTFLRAVYLPLNSVETQVLRPQEDTNALVVLGDSIVSGFVASDLLHSFPALLRRRWNGQVYFDCYGARRFFDESAINEGAQIAAINRLPPKCTLLLELESNDAGDGPDPWGSTPTSVQYQAAKGAWLDQLHTEKPGVKVIAMTALARNGEGTPASGNRLSDLRTVTRTLALERTDWVIPADGRIMLGSSPDHNVNPNFHTDDTHLSDRGSAALVNEIIEYAGRARYGLVGGRIFPGDSHTLVDFRFDEASTPFASTGALSAKTLDVVGTPSLAQGPGNFSAGFSTPGTGRDGAAGLAGDTDVESPDLTVCGWFRLDGGPSGDNTIFAKEYTDDEDFGGAGVSIWADLQSGANLLILTAFSGSLDVLNTGWAPNVGETIFWAVTWAYDTVNTQVIVYASDKKGNLSRIAFKSHAGQIDYGTHGSWDFGCIRSTGVAGGKPCQGQFEQWRIEDVARSQAYLAEVAKRGRY